jgi:hypothetical protein
MNRSTPWTTLCGLLLCGAIMAITPATEAQDRARGRAESDAPSSERRTDDDGPVEADAEVVETRGEKVKVFRFGGLDISGELRSPQVLYFLNRLRAVFDRPRLPHRSFMPELVRSTREEEF